MLKKSYIFAAVLTFSSAQSAFADNACGMIDAVLQTASIVKKMDSKPSPREFKDNIATLDILLEGISVPSLASPTSGDALHAEGLALFTYVSKIREAVAGSQAGYADYAHDTLTGIITPEFSRSLQNLDTHWNCTPPEPTRSDTTDRQDLSQTVYVGQAPAPAVLTPIETAKQLPGNQTSIGGSSRSVGQSGPMFEKGIPLESDTRLFMAIAAIMALLGAYLLRRRSRSYRSREARRIIHHPVKVRLGKKIHQMVMVDISMNGFKVQHPEVIEEHRKLRIFLNGQWHKGKIKWSNKGFAGVRFTKPIDSETFHGIGET